MGRRVKGSKVKVTWKFAFKSSLKTNEVQLKHSLVSGKRVIILNGSPIFNSEKARAKLVNNTFSVESNKITIVIKNSDTKDGYLYDLVIGATPFHMLTRVSAEILEDMRKREKEEQKRKQQTAQKETAKENNKSKKERSSELATAARTYKQKQNTRKNSSRNSLKNDETTYNTENNSNNANITTDTKITRKKSSSQAEEKEDDNQLLISFRELEVTAATSPPPPTTSNPIYPAYYEQVQTQIPVQVPHPYTNQNQPYTPVQTVPAFHSTPNNSVHSPIPSSNLSMLSAYDEPSTSSPESVDLFSHTTDPLEALVNLDDLHSETNVQKKVAIARRESSETSTSYRFKYAEMNKPSARTLVPSQYSSPNGYISPDPQYAPVQYQAPAHPQYMPPQQYALPQQPQHTSPYQYNGNQMMGNPQPYMYQGQYQHTGY